MRNQYSPQMVCKAAVFMALVCIMTLFFKVPIPLGYAHLGNGIILLSGFLLGNPYAVWIGGIGSAMADLLGGYTEWIFPTLVIKGAMGYAIGFLSHPGKNPEKKIMEGVVGVLMFYILGSILEKQKLMDKLGETEG